MMVLTEAAAEVVKSVTSVPQAPDGAGLRITSIAEPAAPGSLELTAAAGPDENDQVVESVGARVFLRPRLLTTSGTRSWTRRSTGRAISGSPWARSVRRRRIRDSAGLRHRPLVGPGAPVQG